MLIDRFLHRHTQEASGGRVMSAAKAVSWRMVGTVDTLIISYFITGKAGVAFSIASIEVLSKMILYYFHERVWERVRSR